ncbi:MAG TPA: hypothetical protein VFV40_00075 [Nocardioides sp.]|nr:hypothetical protein [Nocardioides sp.]
MTRKSITRITTVGLVTGFASLAFAVPAEAREIPDGGGAVSPTYSPGQTVEEGTPWMEIGIGALGGLALAGAGVAAAQSVRHREAVPTA